MQAHSATIIKHTIIFIRGKEKIYLNKIIIASLAEISNAGSFICRDTLKVSSAAKQDLLGFENQLFKMESMVVLNPTNEAVASHRLYMPSAYDSPIHA